MQLKLCFMKHMQSLIVHYSVSLANNQDLLSKSNCLLYGLRVCSIIFEINMLYSFIIVKKPKYPFSLFSALFEENNQNLVKKSRNKFNFMHRDLSISVSYSDSNGMADSEA